MERWAGWLRGHLGVALGVVGTLAVPVVGIIVLRFLFAGPPIDLSAVAVSPAVSAPVVPRPAVAPPEGAPTVMPLVTPTPTPTPTPAVTPTPTPSLIRRVNAEDGLNVRVQPSVREAVVRVLLFQTEVRLTGRQRTSDGLIWVELEPDGWVQARYLDP
ncbi:MAG: SH3 domain-containing protein [Chloroflexi bacterium]|nr:SH3 domain-containing protein [Chloroflexota bacterium]